ncbi:hypothetical protein FOMPIDRAFT_48592 [Fomitopsis schrenkii]|uniref:SWIM-type domain-containing protein n=1 Tax=Fomitopsis schrenkii TaxID=2126942 RepID=S8F168_FOMSC|nr:hypothetical protein FOMPIDRAFT_48592 [Fomitopsis schrenkii]
MYRPVAEGGLGLLDIKARNKAIELMWTKRYLALDENRPMWALAVDALLSVNVRKKDGVIKKKAQVNTFLQDWSPSTHKSSRLPEYLKKMILTAKKFNVSLAAVKLDKEMKCRLPIWYHLGATKKMRRLNNSPESECLRTNHAVTIVADIQKIATRQCFQRASESGNDYIPNNCSCPCCERDRRAGCRHPMKCCLAAKRALTEILPKWHPGEESPKDGLSLTKRREERNEDAFNEGGILTFNPSITQRGELENAFRVFVDPAVHNEPPATRRARGRIVNDETTKIHIVGRQKNSPLTERLPQGTGYARCIEGDIRSALVQPARESEREFQGCGAAIAALGAALAAPRDAPLHYLLDSKDLINILFKNLPEWENEGWIGVRGATYIRALVNQLRQRTAPTTFKKAKSEKERADIDEARAERDETLRDGPPRMLQPVEKAAFKLTGARLNCLTQALAYKGIRELTAPPPRSLTNVTVNAIRQHLRSIPNADEEEADIWEGIRHRDIRKSVTDFLWKGIHNAHRIGKFWTKIPGYEDRATCQHCHERDSLNHILIDCSAPGSSRVWDMAKATWEKKGEIWTHPSIEDIC